MKVDGNKKSRLQPALSRMVPEGKAEIGVLGTRAGCIVQPSWDLTEYNDVGRFGSMLWKKINLLSADVRDAYFHGSRSGKVGVTVAEGEKYIFGKFLFGQNVGSKSWYDLLARVFHGKTFKIKTQFRPCFITVEATRMPYFQPRWTTCKLLDKVTTAK